MNQVLIEQLFQEGFVRGNCDTTPEQLVAKFAALGVPVTLSLEGVSLDEIEDPLIYETIVAGITALDIDDGLTIHRHIDSTNDDLVRTFNAGDPPAITFAEYQTRGHGRRGGAWRATYGRDLCCSIGWPLPFGYRVSGVESLIVALSLVSVLERLGLDQVSVKWPNDIFVNGRKIAGILVEQKIRQNLPMLIVGIGLNLSNPFLFEGDMAYQSTSVAEELGNYERNNVAILLVNGVVNALKRLAPQLDEQRLIEWERHDYLHGKGIAITQDATTRGDYAGVDPHGRLLLNAGGRTLKFTSGHITEISS